MRFFFIGIIILLLSACLATPDCTVTATNNVNVTLKKTNSDSVNFVQFISITASGAAVNFADLDDSVSVLNLPVNPHEIQTEFKFQYNTVVNSVTVVKKDSMTLVYTTKSIIISPECGGYFYYSNLAVSASSFANIPKVVNSQLSTGAKNNIEIKL